MSDISESIRYSLAVFEIKSDLRDIVELAVKMGIGEDEMRDWFDAMFFVVGQHGLSTSVDEFAERVEARLISQGIDASFLQNGD